MAGDAAADDLLTSRRASWGIAAAILVLFLAPRLTLLFVRDIFFDELFTHWLAASSWGGIVDALHHDSGPPLYYFLIHALGNPPLMVVRGISLLFATASLFAILLAGRLGAIRYSAAVLLALFPPAILFAIDARSYALCGMFVSFGVVLLVYRRPGVAAAAFVLAAYSHYYGALFFPLLLLAPAENGGLERPRLRPMVTLGSAVAFFLPGIWLAFHQPREATAWITPAQEWPHALWLQPPAWLAIIGVLLVVVAGAHWNRFTTWTAVPVAAALLLTVAGRPAYMPMRMESVLATPLVLAIAQSLRSWPRRLQRALFIGIVVVAAVLCEMGIVSHVQAPLPDYRRAANYLAQNAPANVPILASGYLYLEMVSQRPNVIAFPPDQSVHPGWRVSGASASGSMLPQGPFLWIGERQAPELAVIRRSRRVEPRFITGRALVAAVR